MLFETIDSFEMCPSSKRRVYILSETLIPWELAGTRVSRCQICAVSPDLQTRLIFIRRPIVVIVNVNVSPGPLRSGEYSHGEISVESMNSIRIYENYSPRI